MILGSSFKDYSNLINPRVKNSDIGITAPVARTLIDVDDLECTEEEIKKDEAENIEDSSQKDLEKERSSLEDGNEDETDDIGPNKKEEVSRRRRDNNDDEEGSSTVEKRRLENVFIPEVEEVEVSSRDGPGTKLSELELEEKRRLRIQRKIQRKKERKEKRKKEHNKQNSEDDLVIDNSDLDDVVGQDKSFDSIASFTGDVTNKVGSVG